MFDTRDLLGAMLGTGMGGRNPRMGGLGGMLGGGGGMPGGLGGMLGGGGMMPGGGGLGGMLGGGGGLGGLGGGMGGLGGMLGGGGMGGMGRRGMGGGLQGALVGMLGGMAMSALQRRMAERASAPVEREVDDPRLGQRRAPAAAPASYDEPASGGGGGEAPEMDEDRARFLVRVMIAAANADMQIDEQERARILGKLEEGGANEAARQFVQQEMRRPMSVDDIAREARGPDEATQAYAAALAAIDVDKAMERRFLQTLAQKLQLDDEIVGEIHEALGHSRTTTV